MKKIIFAIVIVVSIMLFLQNFYNTDKYSGVIVIQDKQINDLTYSVTFQIVDWGETVTVNLDEDFMIMVGYANEVPIKEIWESIRVNEVYQADILKKEHMRKKIYNIENIYL